MFIYSYLSYILHNTQYIRGDYIDSKYGKRGSVFPPYLGSRGGNTIQRHNLLGVQNHFNFAVLLGHIANFISYTKMIPDNGTAM